MNSLYECTNGWCGEAYLRVYVWAPDDETAVRMAKEAFIAKSEKYRDNEVVARLLFRADAEPFATVPDDAGWPD